MKKVAIALVIVGFLWSCSRKPDFERPLPKVHTYFNYLKDEYGRYVYLHGINLSGSTKFPVNEDPCMADPRYDCDPSYLRIRPNYVGKPFPLDEADEHFSRIKEMGFNVVRLLINWEGLQPDGPESVNEEYLDYIEEIVKKAGEYGIYVLMDMHQDIFSRHLLVYYNDRYASLLPEGSIERMATAFIPPYNNAVRGEGAPRWAVKAVLYEKDMDSPVWGYPRILTNITHPAFLKAVTSAVKKLTGMEFEFPPELTDMIKEFFPKYPYDITETTDLLPWTTWGLNAALSNEIQRCFAAMLAGRTVFPKLQIDGKNVQDYLQDAFTYAWRKVAERVGKYSNVIGYDIMNEPVGLFITLTLATLYFEVGTKEGLVNFLEMMFNDRKLAKDIVSILVGLGFIPPDTSEETKWKWGLAYTDLMGVISLNYGFDKNFLQPFFEKVGKAILEKDPDAIIWIEPTLGLDVLFSALAGGGETPLQVNMTKPEGIEQVVFAPHWYADVYPFPGFLMPPREFTPEEVKYREKDYKDSIETTISKATHSLGNIPAVLGEFGTYYNLNGIEKAREEDYIVPQEILDNYYEAMEELRLSHIQWCYSPENTFERGEGWNMEDFSVVDPYGNPRGEKAFMRTHPTFISGKPVYLKFFSYLHYFDPQKGKVPPLGGFEMRFESKESDAPTEIYIPYELYYPEGFYVWVSDGYAIYNHDTKTLYYYPTEDKPGYIHRIRILPPIKEGGYEAKGWKYFFKEKTMVVNSQPLPPEEWEDWEKWDTFREQ